MSTRRRRATLYLSAEIRPTPKAGKPPRLFSQPGKENRKVNVAKNVQTASTLPIKESLAEMGRIAIKRAAVISATQMMLEVAWTLKTSYIQLISGLLAIRP